MLKNALGYIFVVLQAFTALAGVVTQDLLIGSRSQSSKFVTTTLAW
jgi:hypothetical protein